MCYYEGNNIVSLIWQGLQPIFLSEWHLRNSVMQATRLPFCCNVAVYKKLFFPHQSNVNSGSCRSLGAFWCETSSYLKRGKTGEKIGDFRYQFHISINSLYIIRIIKFLSPSQFSHFGFLLTMSFITSYSLNIFHLPRTHHLSLCPISVVRNCFSLLWH